MGLLDGLFVSKEERARRAREFDQRVFPFGLEAQRQAARDLLSTQLGKGRSKDNELLFAFIVAKDKYLLENKGDAGYQAAVRQLKKLGWISKDQKNFILAFLLLETRIQSLDEYPTEEDVHALVARGFDR